MRPGAFIVQPRSLLRTLEFVRGRRRFKAVLVHALLLNQSRAWQGEKIWITPYAIGRLAMQVGSDRRGIKQAVAALVASGALVKSCADQDPRGAAALRSRRCPEQCQILPRGAEVYNVINWPAKPNRTIRDKYGRAILARRDLSDLAKILYMVLSSFGHALELPKARKCRPNWWFARELLVTERGIQKALAQLRAADAIETRARYCERGNDTNEHIIRSSSSWKSETRIASIPVEAKLEARQQRSRADRGQNTAVARRANDHQATNNCKFLTSASERTEHDQGARDASGKVHVVQSLKADERKTMSEKSTPMVPPTGGRTLTQNYFLNSRSADTQPAKTEMPTNFALTDAMREFAQGFGMDADAEFEVWRDDCVDRGKRSPNWLMSWRAYVRRSVKRGRGHYLPGRRPKRLSRGMAELMRAMEEAQERDEERARKHDQRPTANTWPVGFELSDEMRELADRYGVDAEAEFEAWRDHCQALRRRYSDWQTAWREHLRIAVSRGLARMQPVARLKAREWDEAGATEIHEGKNGQGANPGQRHLA